MQTFFCVFVYLCITLPFIIAAAGCCLQSVLFLISFNFSGVCLLNRAKVSEILSFCLYNRQIFIYLRILFQKIHMGIHNKSPPNRALPMQFFCHQQMTRRTTEEPLLVPTDSTKEALIPATELVRVSVTTFCCSPQPKQLNKPPPPKLLALPLGRRRWCNGR